MMGDIKYFYRAMQKEESDQFVDTVAKEVTCNVDNLS